MTTEEDKAKAAEAKEAGTVAYKAKDFATALAKVCTSSPTFVQERRVGCAAHLVASFVTRKPHHTNIILVSGAHHSHMLHGFAVTSSKALTTSRMNSE